MLAPRAMSSYPNAGIDTPTFDPAPPALQPLDSGVWVPRLLRDAITDPARLADLVVLYSWSNDGDVIARQSAIMTALGRPGARPDALGARLRAAEDAGWLVRRRTRRGAGVTRYRLAHRPCPGKVAFDVVPHAMMQALRDGGIGPGELRSWLFLDQALGYRGYTRDSAAEVAARVGVSARTVQRHLTALVSLGFLEREDTATGWVLTRPASTAATTATQVDEIEGELADAPLQGCDTNAGSCDTNAGSMYLAPDSLTPEISPSSRSARHLGKNATRATSGRKRPSGGIYQVDGVREVADLLAQDRAWRWGARRKWLNGILAKAVAPALQRGLTPEAIAMVLTESAAGELDDAAELLQSLIPAAQSALSALAIDTRLGQACQDCGRREADAGGEIRDRLCPWCHEQRIGIEEIPAEILAQIQAHLTAPTTTTQSTDTTAQEVPEMTSTPTTTTTTPAQATHEQRRARDRARRSRYAKRRRLRLLEGTWESTLVPAGPARTRVLELHQQGWSLAALEAMIGESQGHLSNLVYEGHSDARRWVTREREARILDLEPTLDLVPDGCHVPGLGTRRRVQALSAIGWSLQEVADLAGVSKQALAGSLRAHRVTARVARTIRGIYLELESTPGPSERTRRHAATKGWPPPAAWDDVDDPREDAEHTAQAPTHGSRLSVDSLTDCASWGMTREQAAHRLGVRPGSIDRWLNRHEAPGLRARFARNEAATTAA